MGIQETFASGEPFVASKDFRDKSLDPDISYEDLYLFGLSHVQYNILLSDTSYFQFSCGDGEDVRYAYYPNPFLGASSSKMGEIDEMREYVEEGLMPAEDLLHAMSELRDSRHPPIIRYENSASQYVDLIHPCSHFHIGFHSENRWPIARILTPLAFALLIMKLYYSSYWQAVGAGLLEGEANPMDALLDGQRVSSRILPVELFSIGEKRQFSFG